MKNNKNLKLIMMAFIVSFSIVLGILLTNKLEKNNSTILYDFENDKIGDYPEGFVGNMRNITDTHVVYFDDIHKNVVSISYLTTKPNNGVEFNTRFKLTKKGIIEFDVYGLYYKRINIDVCQTDAEYDYRDDIVIRIPITSLNKHVGIMDNIGQLEEVLRFQTERWYSFKIEFDVESGWKLWIDGNLMQLTEYLFNKVPPYFCQLYFATYEIGNIFYVDNVKITLRGGE